MCHLPTRLVHHKSLHSEMDTEKIFSALKNVAVVISIVAPVVGVGGWAINSVKQDILNEFRNEAATVRIEFLRDVEERYDDVSFEINRLEKSNQPVPEYMRSKQKRLERRMQSLKEAK